MEVTYSSSEDALLEISAAGVSKASALAAVCSARGIAAEEVIAFGDMPNDLPMLTWAGRGVAVANAHPEVLAAADEITAGNDECGVAQVLERLLERSAAGPVPASLRVADVVFRDEQRLAFGAVAELYDRVRPSYPTRRSMTWSRRPAARRRPVLEVGAGTGKATVLLATSEAWA